MSKQYAEEAETLRDTLRKQMRRKEEIKDQSVLTGKAGAMGEPILAFNGEGGDQKTRDKAASAAYDATMNMRESMAEDADASAKLHRQKMMADTLRKGRK